jgi:hypothetical protein
MRHLLTFYKNYSAKKLYQDFSKCAREWIWWPYLMNSLIQDVTTLYIQCYMYTLVSTVTYLLPSLGTSFQRRTLLTGTARNQQQSSHWLTHSTDWLFEVEARSYFTKDSLGIEHPCGTCDQILLPVGMLLSETCSLGSVGRPLWRDDGSEAYSAITQWSESIRTRNHTLLSHLRLPQPGGPGSRMYIPQEEGGPVIPPGTGLPLRRLLRLAGLRWRNRMVQSKANSIWLAHSSSGYTYYDRRSVGQLITPHREPQRKRRSSVPVQLLRSCILGFPLDRHSAVV